jgi:phosphoglycolate phosphatase-like HAD superfamily hydrolase
VSALVLFDVDGTLLLSGGAGVRAMTLAFERVFGVADAFEGIPIAGYTDTFLVSRALTRAALPDTVAAHASFRTAYLELLPDEIVKPGTGRKGLMPGVRELLDELSADPAMHFALLTGNYEAAAFIKLAHFGVGAYFSWGAFGEDSPHRAELAQLALRRAAARTVPASACDNAVVIGDTPHDVACARAIGARVLAVATGGYSVEQLAASGADAIVDDLTDTNTIVRQLRGVS